MKRKTRMPRTRGSKETQQSHRNDTEPTAPSSTEIRLTIREEIGTCSHCEAASHNDLILQREGRLFVVCERCGWENPAFEIAKAPDIPFRAVFSGGPLDGETIELIGDVDVVKITTNKIGHTYRHGLIPYLVGNGELLGDQDALIYEGQGDEDAVSSPTGPPPFLRSLGYV